MTTKRWYVTSAIPYVNGDPHLGHALEFVQADALARWRRFCGDEVRSLWGTDDHAAKNVHAARDAGENVQEFVDRRADAFEGLAGALQLGFDDFIRTSRDARHRPAVERLWSACRAAGDLYRDRYEGLYCQGCEQFYDPSDLADGRCPEHDVKPDTVVEENWFFRLSRYAGRVASAIRSGQLRVEPAHRRNEILAFLDGDVRDISVSRPAARSDGWGIPVPDDPSQIIYVWFDALTNYISALGYGTAEPDYDAWWCRADRRVHVIGKGILRFHAAYWPAFLLAAGEPLPTDVLVHEYLTVEGNKISKSRGATASPAGLVDTYGSDALRWWLLRDVNAVGDTDFRIGRLVQRHDQDLANAVGNLITRVEGLVRRYGHLPSLEALPVAEGSPTDVLQRSLPAIDEATGRLDLRAATTILIEAVTATNGWINHRRPWELLGDRERRDHAGPVLAELARACRQLTAHLEPFLPVAATRIRQRVANASDGPSQAPFPRLETRDQPRQTKGDGPSRESPTGWWK